MITKFKIFEKTDYYSLHDDDKYQITKTVMDNGHDYQYCDGILYELSGNDSIVGIDEVEYTEGNEFYEDQIERYVEYFEDGGITQTFSVSETPLGGCRNLEEMLEYLDEPDNFDMAWDLLSKYHKKLFDESKWDITSEPHSYGFSEGIKDLTDIVTIDDLDEFYNQEEDEANEDREGDWDEELYLGFHTVIEHWQDAKEYSLTDFNHRFAAIERMGKKQVMIDSH